MRAGLVRGHLFTFVAVKGVVEEERHDAYLFGGKGVKNLMGIEGSVVIPDPGMVAAHDEVSTAVVLADQGVKDRLTGARVAHRSRIDREDYTILWVVIFNQDFVTFHPDIGGNIVPFGLADDRVNQEPVADLESPLRE